MNIPLVTFHDDMSFVDRAGDVFFLVVAYPIVMLYLYMCDDGSSVRIVESGEAIKRHEKAASDAMKERKKYEPKILRADRDEISLVPPTTRTISRCLGLVKQCCPRPPQSQSCPLLNLPLEIREKIYSEVIGQNIFHITQLPRRLGHIRCTSTRTSTTPDEIICTRDCFHPNLAVQTYRHGEFLDLTTGSEDSLSLLQTCRQIYHEASRTLYESNTFDFNHPQTLNFFARSIRPSRLAMIRHLNLTWSGVLPFLENEPSKSPDDLQTWQRTWDIIGNRITSLRTLKVFMLIYDDPHEKSRSGLFLEYARKRWTANGSQFEKLLGEMMANVRGLRDFRLGIKLPEEMCWDVEELEGKMRGIVCEPRRTTLS